MNMVIYGNIGSGLLLALPHSSRPNFRGHRHGRPKDTGMQNLLLESLQRIQGHCPASRHVAGADQRVANNDVWMQSILHVAMAENRGYDPS